MILGILRPTSGEVHLFDNRVNGSAPEIRRRIGVVSEKQYLYPEMTLWEYLNFFGQLYRATSIRGRIEELTGRVGLADVLDRRIGAFSRGMQQKVGFARALLHDPDLLILDEPVSGLDPMGILRVRTLIEEENRRGKTVFVSSHLLSEIERLCHRVGIMSNGELLAEDRMDNLVRRLASETQLDVEFAEEQKQVAATLKGRDYVRDVSVDGRFLRVKIKTDRDYRKDVVEVLISQGLVPIGIQLRPMTLEEAFITITKENISLITKAGA
jgi:ABC-2 type transport system ATP-binding protein